MRTVAVRYRVLHETLYDSEQAASTGHHLAHLTPRNTPWQRLESHTVSISPAPSEKSSRLDYFGNTALHFSHATSHRTLGVRADSIVEVRSQIPGWDVALPWEDVVRDLRVRATDEAPPLAEFCLASPNVPVLTVTSDYARVNFTPRRPLLEALVALTERIRKDFVYDPLATTISTPIAEVAQRRRGVCQDFAHFMLSGLRGLGLAARYMSGYILNEPTAQSPAPRGADTSHAWVAVYCAGSSWIGCDPTNGKLADLEFVTLGWGRDFSDVTPLRGVVLGAGTPPPKVAVEVIRL